ncbi:MAG: ABC transporter ATP-binding protein [delta proteobacterium ML8_F1]|nr:MAG: ABC transporter ATP-binding protein [delta proteobacterium ML8_F1]
MNSCPDNKILEIEGLSKDYKGQPILENIHLELKEEEFVTLLGPSGCGKSTLFNLIAGLITPKTGTILLKGEDVTGQTGRVSYMHQKDLLLPWRDVIGNGAVPLEIRGHSKEDARREVADSLAVFGLDGHGHKYPSQLSGGMRQRVSLLRTTMFSKEIMLLDEPFGGLDAMTRFAMQQYLLKVLKEIRGSVIFITHDIEEAVFLSDRIYVMKGAPARIVDEVRVPLEKPRKPEILSLPEFHALREYILKQLEE